MKNEKIKKKKKINDLIIIGAGPAGLGASIYASRYKLDHLVIGGEIGGQVTEASEIENYAGFDSISGRELMARFQKQTEDLGAEIIQSDVKQIIKKENIFKVEARNGETYQSRTILLAVGMKPRRLNIPGEKEFIGKGVSYCATCDAMFFRNKIVAVVGGGDSAAMAAVHLSEFADKIYLLHKKDPIWSPAREDGLLNNKKVKMLCYKNITEIKGDGKIESVILEEEEKDNKEEIELQGIFIEIGSVPSVSIAKRIGVKTDEKDYIIVDQMQATNIENIWAAGDVTTASNKFRQIITAVAEGAVAAGSIYKKLKLQ